MSDISRLERLLSLLSSRLNDLACPLCGAVSDGKFCPQCRTPPDMV